MRMLALPVAIHVVLSSSFALIDTLMVGDLGAMALGGVELIGRINMLIGMLLGGTGSAVGMLGALEWGCAWLTPVVEIAGYPAEFLHHGAVGRVGIIEL